jgi:hypothetical protein
MKKYSFIFAVCSILCLTATRAYSQRHNFELAFQASGMSDGDSCLVSLTAVNGLTRGH